MLCTALVGDRHKHAEYHPAQCAEQVPASIDAEPVALSSGHSTEKRIIFLASSGDFPQSWRGKRNGDTARQLPVKMRAS